MVGIHRTVEGVYRTVVTPASVCNKDRIKSLAIIGFVRRGSGEPTSSCHQLRPSLEIPIIYFEHPHPKASLHKKRNVSLPPSTVFLAAQQLRCKNIDTLLLGTPGIFCAWALQGYFSVGPCRDIWWLDTVRILCSWALQGYFAVGHCMDTLRLGTARILSG